MKKTKKTRLARALPTFDDGTNLFEFVTVGDTHLDKLENLFPELHLQLQMAEVEKVFTYAIKNGVPHVVFLGDVAHKERLSEEAWIALYSLIDYYDGKLNIHIILGNHDVARQGVHSLQKFVKLYESGKFKSVFVYKEQTQVIINNVPVNFLSFPATKAIPSDLADRTVNFAHLERPGAVRDNGVKIQKGHGVKQKDDHLWFIGHLHTPQQLGTTWFSGTLYQTNFGESLPKSFLHARIRNKGGKLSWKVVQVPNDPRFKFFNLKVERKSDLKQIESNPLYLYKVFIKKGVKLDVDLNARYANIINTPSMYSTEQELAEQQQVQELEISHSLTDGLNDVLRSRGASKWQMKRARTIVKSIVKELDSKAA